MEAEDAHSRFLLGPIKEIVSQVNPGLIITPQAAEFVNTKIDLVLYYILNAVSKLDQDQVVGVSELEILVRATLQPTMAQWGIQEGRVAYQAFKEAKDDVDRRIAKTGLTFPPKEIETLLIERHPKAQMEGAIFLAGVLEYVCADLLQASGNRAIEGENGETLGLPEIVQTMAEDDELSKLFFVVSSKDTENIFLRRKSSENHRSASLLIHPAKKKSAFKYDSKPFPVEMKLPEAFLSSERASEGSTDENWDIPPIPPKRENAQPPQNHNIYGGSRALSISMGSDTLQKMSKKEGIVQRSGGQKSSPNPQISSFSDLTKGTAPTLSVSPLHSDEVGLHRNSSKNIGSPGDSIFIKVNLPDNQKTTVEVSKEMTCGELLRYVVQKRCLKFDEYVLKSSPVAGESSEQLEPNFAVGNLKILEVSVCPRAFHAPKVKKDSSATSLPEDTATLYLSEGDRDVLVMEVRSGRAQVIAGTIEKLIERLADENRQDTRYVDCILLTFRFYMKPNELFEQLVLRFLIQPPSNPTQEELEYYEEWKKPIQKKVVNVIKWWVDNYWQDFNNHAALLGNLLEFVKLIRKEGFEAECELLEESILSQIQGHRNLRSLPTTSPAKQSQFLLFQPNEIAEQLNLWDFELFRNIQPVEYVNNVLTKDPKLFPNLDLFIQRFEIESFWVATEVCLEKDIRRRALILESFIRIAKYCRDTRNFFSTFSIVGGLMFSCVQRLKSTWANVPPKTLEVFHSLEEIMSPYQNMKNYRDNMLASHPPIIPVLPIYMKDLLFSHDGNKTFVNQLVNFEKFRMIANQIRQIVALASIPYEIEDPQKTGEYLRNYIRNPIVIADLGKLSELCASL